MDALHLLEKADKVLAIDALQAGGVPGTVYAARVADLENRGVQASLHELSLLAALHFLRRRPEILILGVEPETIQFGMSLSPRVEAAIPELIRHVLEAVGRWRRAPPLVHNSRHGPNSK
jgi:hydrogenase maturation protease